MNNQETMTAKPTYVNLNNSNNIDVDFFKLSRNIKHTIDALDIKDYQNAKGISDIYLFTDFETDGVNLDKAEILEANVLVTIYNRVKREFKILADINAVFKAKIDTDNMDNPEWIFSTHGKSGLLGEVATSNLDKSLFDSFIENIIVDTFEYLGISPENKSLSRGVYLVGSGIHFDKEIIDRHFPRFQSVISYRLLDCTSFFLAYMAIGKELPSGNENGELIVSGDLVNNIKHKHRARYDNYLSLLRMSNYLNDIAKPEKEESYKDMVERNGVTILKPSGTNYHRK